MLHSWMKNVMALRKSLLIMCLMSKQNFQKWLVNNTRNVVATAEKMENPYCEESHALLDLDGREIALVFVVTTVWKIRDLGAGE